jgi:hypothetical protein
VKRREFLESLAASTAAITLGENLRGAAPRQPRHWAWNDKVEICNLDSGINLLEAPAIVAEKGSTGFVEIQIAEVLRLRALRRSAQDDALVAWAEICGPAKAGPSYFISRCRSTQPGRTLPYRIRQRRQSQAPGLLI